MKRSFLILFLIFLFGMKLKADSTTIKPTWEVSISLFPGYHNFPEVLSNHDKDFWCRQEAFLFGYRRGKSIWRLGYNHVQLTADISPYNKNRICFDCYQGSGWLRSGEVTLGLIRELGKHKFKPYCGFDAFYQHFRYQGQYNGGFGGGWDIRDSGFNVGISVVMGIRFYLNKGLFLGVESNAFYMRSSVKTAKNLGPSPSDLNAVAFSPLKYFYLGIKL